jgi:hypothetical protein
VFSLDQLTVNFEDIKEAFRRLAKEHHLDKGGDSRGSKKTVTLCLPFCRKADNDEIQQIT